MSVQTNVQPCDDCGCYDDDPSCVTVNCPNPACPCSEVTPEQEAGDV